MRFVAPRSALRISYLPAITGEVGVATGEAPDSLADNTAAKTDATEIPDNILSMGQLPWSNAREALSGALILPEFCPSVTGAR